MALAISDDRTRGPSALLMPAGCDGMSPGGLLDVVRIALRERSAFRARIPLAPMPVARVGRLQKWVERERPESLSVFMLDAPTPERTVVRHFAKHGLCVEIVRAGTLPLSYELVVLT